MSNFLKGSIAILALCLVMQGIWMGIAPDPYTIAPVFKLIGGLALLGGIVIGVLLSLAACVGAAVYVVTFDNDEGNAMAIGILAFFAWFFSVAIIAQTNVKGQPIDLPTDEISAMRFAVLGAWALVFSLAGLKAYFRAQRKKKENA